MMRYVLILIALAYGLVTNADTLNERMTALQGGTGVLAARLEGTPTQVVETPVIHQADVTYWIAEGDTVTVNRVVVIIVDYNGGSEAAYWYRRVPDVLRPAPVAPTYFTDRNTPFTAAQIESYCNTLWVDLNPTAGPIIEFTVSAVDGKTVRVSGRFDVGGSSREQREYYIWLVDVNGSTAVGNANVKFERITP